MVLYSSKHNLPYVQAADTVSSYPVTSQDLATKLDAVICKPVLYCALKTGTCDGNGFIVVTQADLGMSQPPVGCVASLAYTASITTQTDQVCAARPGSGGVQVRIWQRNTTGNLIMNTSGTVTVFCIAW